MAARRNELEQSLSHFVHLREVADCTDLRTVRWEIVNFSAVRDWNSVLELFSQLSRNRLMAEAKICALRGQFLFARALFAHDEAPSLWVWNPRIRKSFDLIETGPLVFVGLSLPTPDRQSSETDILALHDAANDLQKALLQLPGLPPLYHFMAARSLFGKQDFSGAAKHYEYWLENKVPWLRAEWDEALDLTHLTFRCLATAHQRAGDVDNAKRVSDKWIRHKPRIREPYEFLARLHKESGNHLAAAETYRRFQDANPEVPEDDKTATILALAPLASPLERVAATLESDPRCLRFVIGVISEYWPALRSLSEESQKDWVKGVLAAHDDSRFGVLGTSRYDFAIDSMGKALERELKTRVFEPFASAARSDKSQSGLGADAEDSDAMRYFARFIREPKNAYLTLGQMCAVLNKARRPKSPLSQRFGGWLKTQKLRLLEWMDEDQLNRLADFWRPARHAGSRQLSDSDAAEFADLARGLLSCLHPRSEALAAIDARSPSR